VKSDFFEFAAMSAPIVPVIYTIGVNDDVSIWRFVCHSLSPQLSSTKGFAVTDDFSNREKTKYHLRMATATRKDEEDDIPWLNSCAEIVPTDSPGRRRSPKVRIVIDP